MERYKRRKRKKNEEKEEAKEFSLFFLTHCAVIIQPPSQNYLHIMRKREKLSRQQMNYTQLIGEKEGGEHLHINNSSQTQWDPNTLVCI